MTLTDDRLGTTWMASSLTTAPKDRLRPPEPLGSTRHTPRHSGAARRELMVYAEDDRLPRWFNDHLNVELNRLFALPAGWDGYTADEATIEAVREIVNVLFLIVSQTITPPQFFPLADGGIQAEWHIGGNDVEIEVNGEGSAYVLATKTSGETVADAEIRANEDDPAVRAVATFLIELSARSGLAHLWCDIRDSGGGVILCWRRPQNSERRRALPSSVP